MKNTNFKVKLILLCVFLSVVSIVISTVSYFGVSDLNGQSNFFSENIIPRNLLLSEMDVSYQKTRIQVRTLGLSDIDSENRKIAISNTMEMIENYELAASKLQKKITNAEEQKIFDDLQDQWVDFKKVGARALELAQINNSAAKAELQEIFLVHCPEAAENYQRVLDKYNSRLSKEVTSSAAVVSSTASRLQLTIVIVSLVGILLGFSIGVIYASSISRKIKATISALTNTSISLTKSAKSIATTSNELSLSSERQDSSLQESSSSLEEISSMVRMTADNAKKSNNLAEESLDKAAVGKKIVKNMIDSMGNIDGNIDVMVGEFSENNKKMLHIVELINQIEERTQVINDIVFQTKLLSFNASVEAARAGDAGKGFAVVAEEVGKLAQMSGNASIEISEMVSTSVHEVNSIVEESNMKLSGLVQKVKTSVTSGSEVASQCGQILEEIVSSVENVTNSITEITSATFEQSKGITELQGSISSIDVSSKSNTGIAKGASNIADQLLNEVSFVNRSIGEIELVFLGEEERKQAA
ncbi:signal transduction four helix bundle sensory module [Bacteriovorax sp. BAL6_X]|uniref:HAMP domain-containing methyl-accepting chemotaxis protein n=1 Tax=Bacteriovorax sp. BAL6_X TaxID=1201290 RepID=UPI0003864AB4|nr:methyl-accepting chemotaxis protein [Bacteriovorax sp. BAL6_X]EPZ52049.1 signal transduction four helix bundle sensory module [Bacteriovorax sp. BAL6_X]